MNEPLPPEVKALQFALDAVDKAFDHSSHKAIVLSQAALAVHDQIIRTDERLAIAAEIQAFMQRHTELSIEAMRELWAAVMPREVLERGPVDDAAREDQEREHAALERDLT